MKPWNERTPSDYTDHDRVFATAGRGINGNITEFMSGIKANVALDVEYGSALRHVWVFPTRGGETSAGFTVLLGLHNQSAVVELSPELDGIREPTESDAGFDTSARTLAASQLQDGTVCQITETSLLLLGQSQRYVVVLTRSLIPFHSPTSKITTCHCPYCGCPRREGRECLRQGLSSRFHVSGCPIYPRVHSSRG